MNPLKRGLDAVKAVKKNKLLFVILVLIQIAFIVSVAVVGVTYQLKIYENVIEIMEPLQDANYDPAAIEEGQPFMNDMMKEMVAMAKNYQELVKNILMMLFLMVSFCFIFNGLSWSLVNYMVKRGKWWKYWGKFVLVSLLFLIPVSLVGYFVLKGLVGLEIESFKLGIKVVGGVFLVIGYFLLAGFCLLEEKVKDLLKKIFLIGVKKAPWMLLGVLVYLLLILLGLGLVYFSMKGVSFILVVLSLLVLVVVMVLGKLFLVGVVKGIKEMPRGKGNFMVEDDL